MDMGYSTAFAKTFRYWSIEMETEPFLRKFQPWSLFLLPEQVWRNDGLSASQFDLPYEDTVGPPKMPRVCLGRPKYLPIRNWQMQRAGFWSMFT